MSFEIVDGVLKKYRGKARHVVIPEGVRTIGEEAFADNGSMKTVVIPSTVTRIEGFAFSPCKALSTVTVPSSVTDIGGFVFLRCANLEEAFFLASTHAIEMGTFYECKKLSRVTIGEGIREIQDFAFCDCLNLRTMYMPDSLEVISKDAFFINHWGDECLLGYGRISETVDMEELPASIKRSFALVFASSPDQYSDTRRKELEAYVSRQRRKLLSLAIEYGFVEACAYILSRWRMNAKDRAAYTEAAEKSNIKEIISLFEAY